MNRVQGQRSPVERVEFNGAIGPFHTVVFGFFRGQYKQPGQACSNSAINSLPPSTCRADRERHLLYHCMPSRATGGPAVY